MDVFAGVEVEYDWWSFEGAPGDYDAGFQALDQDLAVVADGGKKLMLFLQYKNFGAGVAVPDYLLDAGPWCALTDAGDLCGECVESNATEALFWQGQDAGGVADRLAAWIAAAGDHVLGGPYASAVAGVVFPESAGGCTEDDSIEIGGLEATLLAGHQAFPGVPIFQFINFLHGRAASQRADLQQFAVWVEEHPFAGLGCPDVAPVPYAPDAGQPVLSDGGLCGAAAFDSSNPPPGYSVLIDAGFQGRIPFDVAVEYQDYSTCATPSMEATYATATRPAAEHGMAAQYVAWANVASSPSHGHFGLSDAIPVLQDAGPFPNTAVPTW